MKKFFNKNRKKAFSLIELSIVIVIASILITGALSVSVNAVNNSKSKVSKDRIAEIYRALGNYLVANKKLPCPAPITDLKSTTATYGTAASTSLCASTSGVSQSSTSSNLMRGMVPVKTLGLPYDMAEDGFGDKFEYVVDKNLTVASSGSSSDFGTASTMNIAIYEKPGSSANQIESAAAFAIISLGGNKSGAYPSDMSARNTISTDTEEAYNTPSSTSNDTLYTSTLYVSSGNSDVFDDVVFYKTRSSLVTDFNALSLIPCASATETLYGTTITWPLAWYDQVAVSSTACPAGYTSGGATYPTKRCGAFGAWDVVINPCLAP